MWINLWLGTDNTKKPNWRIEGYNRYESYIKIRIKDHLRMLENIKGIKDISKEMAQFLSEYVEQMEIRCKYAEGEHRQLLKMLSYLKYNKATILFEIIAMRLPEKAFKKALDIIKVEICNNLRIPDG